MDKSAFFGFGSQNYKKAKLVIMPVPYDSALGTGGSADAPDAIIEASQGLEGYDNEMEIDIGNVGISTSEPVDGKATSVEAMIGKVSSAVGAVVKDKKTPVILGGDHTVSLGAISALVDAGVEFDVLNFDAHSGTRDTFNDSKYAHECHATRIREMVPCYSIDVRSGDLDGLKKLTDNILTTPEMKQIGLDAAIKRVGRKTGRSIYISFNFDFMRLSDMPSVRNPEPGGLSYGKTIQMLSGVMANKSVVGMDFVGLSPIEGLTGPNVVAAKLVQKTICYVFKQWTI